TAAPVRGFRAVRALRCVWLQPPKPGRETFSPFFTDCCTVLMKALMTFSTSGLPMAVSFVIWSTSWVLFTTTSRVNGCFNVESEPTNGSSSSTISRQDKESCRAERPEPLWHNGFPPPAPFPQKVRKVSWMPLQDPCGARRVARRGRRTPDGTRVTEVLHLRAPLLEALRGVSST